MATRTAEQELPEETPDTFGAYPRLNEAQIAVLHAHGERHTTEVHEVLYERHRFDPTRPTGNSQSRVGH